MPCMAAGMSVHEGDEVMMMMFHAGLMDRWLVMIMFSSSAVCLSICLNLASQSWAVILL